MRTKQVCFAALLSLLFAAASFASGAEVQAHSAKAAVALTELLRPLQTLQGQFKQRQVTADGELLVDSEGHFILRRPNQLRWKTDEPYPQLLVSDGTTLWLYDPDLEQVTVSDVSGQLAQTPVVIFTGDVAAIEERYFVSGGSDTEQVYSLVPRQDNSQFRKLELKFSGSHLQSMILLDGFGQTTRFDFFDVRENLPVEDSEFRFSPPAGVDILHNE